MKIKIAVMAFCFIGSACESKHLVYVQESNLGLNFGIGTNGTAKLGLGYEREVYAIVPKTGDGENDAMSLFSLNKISVESINKLSVEEFVASGEPAAEIANNAQAIKQLRDKIYDGGDQ